MEQMEREAEKAVVEKIAPALLEECAADVKFYGVSENGAVKVGLKTTCGNCPRAHATIKQSVEVALKTIVPDVPGIEPFFL